MNKDGEGFYMDASSCLWKNVTKRTQSCASVDLRQPKHSLRKPHGQRIQAAHPSPESGPHRRCECGYLGWLIWLWSVAWTHRNNPPDSWCWSWIFQKMHEKWWTPKNTVLRIIPTMTFQDVYVCVCIYIYKYMWTYSLYIRTIYLTYILTFYLAYILASYLLYVLAFYLAYILAFYLTYILTWYLAYIMIFYLAFYLADLLAFYLNYIFWHSFWHSICHSIWHSF